MSAFERLNSAVQHHVVNALGWRSLRPLQEAAIDPVRSGAHVLLGAPTAGGKTEAALLPLLSRMADEDWGGLSVLYVCPLRALLNNLLPRVQSYAAWLGRTAAVWHGDVGDRERRAILREPPDLLLTTPESLEAMFMSRRVEAGRLLGGVRAVVVDEVHAFGADDRGWHLLSVLARLDDLTGSEIQRLGLTATVGNPEALLDWLVCGGANERQVVMPAAEQAAAIELALDFVGSVSNAAMVVAALHRGEKRLVFADSRARVEELAVALRGEGVEVFVSHSSLSPDERRLAERAFAERSDCVIVATSALELGIDVGDLDRVIQLGAPRTVASVLQRSGRSGRRAETVRNCLFLATDDDDLLIAGGLIELLEAGWVEPLEAPARPVNLLAQQLLARVLERGRVARRDWPGVLGRVVVQTGLDQSVAAEILEWMVGREVLVEDAGLVAMGPTGEREYGRRHFMEVTSVFLTEPLLAVRWGQRELGAVDPSSLIARDHGTPTILLGGRAWGVRHVDWDRRVVWVEPVDEPGRSRWAGTGGALSLDVCHAIRGVLAAPATVDAHLTQRGRNRLAGLREQLAWVREGRTALVRDTERSRSRWWTFAGARANAALAARLDRTGIRTTGFDDLGIGLRVEVSHDALVGSVASILADTRPPVEPRRIAAVKFASCVPEPLLASMLQERDADERAVETVLREPVLAVSR